MGFNKTCHKSLCLLCCLAFIWWNETHFELFFVVHVSLKSIRCWKGKFSTFTYYLITVYSDWLGFVTLLRKFISFKKSFKFGKVSWNISVTSIFLGLRLNRINLLFGENCTKNWKKKNWKPTCTMMRFPLRIQAYGSEYLCSCLRKLWPYSFSMIPLSTYRIHWIGPAWSHRMQPRKARSKLERQRREKERFS